MKIVVFNLTLLGVYVKRFLFVLVFAAWSGVSACAIAPMMITFSCGEGNAPGWIVYEDRNGDGNMDWQTARGCNDKIVTGPFPPPIGGLIQVGIITSERPASFDFSSSSCGSNVYSWEVVEKDANGNPIAFINQDCYDNIVISYPAIIKRHQSPDRGDAIPNTTQPNKDYPVSIFPNPTSAVVNLSAEIGRVNLQENFTVEVIDRLGRTRYLERIQGDKLLKDFTIDTSLLTPGSYTISVQSSQGAVIAQKQLSIIK